MMIEAIDVRKTFQSGDEVVEALRGVTFQLPTGSCTFIVGPSGSGKSTLLYLLAALDLPTLGTIRVADQAITSMPEDERDAFRRKRVGFIYQSFNLIGNLTAVDNVLLPYIPIGITPEFRSKARRPAPRSRPGPPDETPSEANVRRRAAAGGDRPRPDPRPNRDLRRRADR